VWIVDIYCDWEWVAARASALGPSRFKLTGARSASGIALEFHFYGDDYAIRHVRVLADSDDKEAVDRLVDLNIQLWVAAIETAVTLETGTPFHVPYMPGSQSFAVAQAPGDINSPAPSLRLTHASQRVIDYRQMSLAFAAWPPALAQYLFYFRRFIDASLPLDVRWLNGYRLLEWHFSDPNAKKHLSRSQNWRAFVDGFANRFAGLARTGQSAVGLLEEARALAAHAGLDERSDNERRIDRRNAVEKTFPILHHMVAAVLQQHPAMRNGPVRLDCLLP